MKVSSWLCLLACWTEQILTTGQESGYSLSHEVPMPLIKCLTAKIELLSENSHACTGCKLKARERGFWSFALMTKWTALGTVPLELVGLSKISSCCITLRHTSMHVLRKQNREFQCNWGHYKMLQEISLKKCYKRYTIILQW